MAEQMCGARGPGETAPQQRDLTGSVLPNGRQQERMCGARGPGEGAPQQRLDDDSSGSTSSAGQPSCSASCAGRVPPSSSGCGADFTGPVLPNGRQQERMCGARGPGKGAPVPQQQVAQSSRRRRTWCRRLAGRSRRDPGAESQLQRRPHPKLAAGSGWGRGPSAALLRGLLALALLLTAGSDVLSPKRWVVRHGFGTVDVRFSRTRDSCALFLPVCVPSMSTVLLSPVLLPVFKGLLCSLRRYF